MVENAYIAFSIEAELIDLTSCSYIYIAWKDFSKDTSPKIVSNIERRRDNNITGTHVKGMINGSIRSKVRGS